MRLAFAISLIIVGEIPVNNADQDCTQVIMDLEHL